MAKNNNVCGGLYTSKVMETFKNPHNFGKIKNPDGTGKVGNIVCGDVMHLYIKVGRNKKNQDIIKDVRFETFGCVAAISTSSIITDMAKGKTINRALKITKDNVIKSLGGLPKIKYHCSVLAVDALTEAIFDYLTKNKMPISEEFKKRHEIIKKSEEIINERYKKWEN
ncbi:MAG: iron-sulfur cluster assembly scaffold protein [Candidatus Staskawiczbacteria bacterium RIFOXYC1_FULL_37_43]|nr:MAG: iron-sulfur cluster assembly scaffold protein [Candidatus Staskawiczbacteria bacterium RIFCSPHIGHO2_01_FULL_37_17]OGZ72061.1 MAG: iron-sulfur cluster assembly scaffold protein [Candidatus Staskawiczbacteria bacterium RIFCSPLOWO2_01_FULL_37_19]OGZ75773.1 MAG: iron-sulfur cluster assembly scaffold protein [Candidatus Staskawiczbacteria bacterium RIFOXYA1_FULL_37_15]OGZ77175.1 MAG: iron-sulfur cluster assembly scaffold protein [Candidatus Staskawiczbacteria bacterium RIFOXYA12_FULL_37_10]O